MQILHVDSQSSADGEAVYVFDNFLWNLCPNQYIMPNAETSWLKLSTIQLKSLLLELFMLKLSTIYAQIIYN